MNPLIRVFCLVIWMTCTFHLGTAAAQAELCRMGKSAYSENAIVCECPQLRERDNGNYDVVSRRLICDVDGTKWKEADDGGPTSCFSITNLGRGAQITNLNRLSQAMAGCSP